MNVLLDGKLEPGARNREGTRQHPSREPMIIAKAGQDDRCILGSASILAPIPCITDVSNQELGR
jgi:hypothetical protein